MVEELAQGRVALVTGGSRGIGAATSHLLAARGHQVAVNYRSNSADADAVVESIRAAGGRAASVQGDVCDPDDVARIVAESEEKLGPVDVLVHNALIPYVGKSFEDISWDELGEKNNLELQAAFHLTKAVSPGMRERGFGRIVFVSTALARKPRQKMIALGTAKAGLSGFARFVAQEYGQYGITVNVVAPGPVDTTEIVTIMGPFGEQRERIINETPMRRLALPDDVARVIGFFVGEDGSYVTGTFMTVNGGYTMD